MNILIVDQNLPPYIIDGSRVHTYNLCKALARRGHNVHVLVEKTSVPHTASMKGNVHEFPWDGINVHRLVPSATNPFKPTKELSWLIFDLNAGKYIAKLTKKIKLDIIHGDGAHSGLLLSDKFAVPHVVTIHGNFYDEASVIVDDIRKTLSTNLKAIPTLAFYGKCYIGAQLHAYAEKVACNLADKIIALTNYEKIRLNQVYSIPYSKIAVIPNFVDYERIQKVAIALPEKEKIKEEILGKSSSKEKVIAYTGFLKPRKGLDILIKAMAIIKKLRMPYKLLIIGSGPLEKEVKAMINKEGLEEQVTMLNYVPFEKMVAINLIADCIVVPSLFEGLPTTMLEAMALGKPVIASSVGGIPEVIKDKINGILFKPKDPHMLADKIIELMDSEDLRTKLGLNARETVKEKYDINVVVKDIERLYLSLAR
jgi:glycosyltransferase involved in cell wall biosynthesis